MKGTVQAAGRTRSKTGRQKEVLPGRYPTNRERKIRMKLREGKYGRYWMITAAVLTAAMVSGCGSSSQKPAETEVKAKAETQAEAKAETGETASRAEGAGEQKEVTLKYSTTSTPGTVFVQAFQRMADEVEEKTGGKVHVVIYDSSQLGNESDVDTNVQDGSIDMCNTGSGELGKRYAAFNVFQAPYLFGSYEHFNRFIGSDVEAELFEKAGESLGVTICGTQTMGARYVITTGAKATTPAEFAGVKIRCPDMPAIISTVNGLGATATPMAATEQYLAMQQGVVDGAEHTLSGFCAWNIQELCKTLMLTNHAREVTFTMISRDCMDKLTEENQKILLDAVNSAAAWANQQTNEDEETLMAQFEEEYGMELVEVDAEAFRQSLEPVSQQLSADDPELFAAIQGLE